MYRITLLTVVMLTVLVGGVTAQDAENVELVGRIYNQWDEANDVVVVDDLAYVATGLSGLQIVDVSDPEYPITTGIWDDCISVSNVEVSGEYAQVVDDSDTLCVINISNPQDPYLVSRYGTQDHIYDLSISDNFAYAVIRNSGLHIIDIRDPENLNEVGYYEHGELRVSLFPVTSLSQLVVIVEQVFMSLILETLKILQRCAFVHVWDHQRAFQLTVITRTLRLPTDGVKVQVKALSIYACKSRWIGQGETNFSIFQ